MVAWWHSRALAEALELGREVATGSSARVLHAPGRLGRLHARDGAVQGEVEGHWLQLEPARALLWPVGEVLDLALNEAHLCLVHEGDQGLELLVLEQGSAWRVRAPEGTRWIKAGWPWILVGDRDGIGVVDLRDGSRPALPTGARTPRAAPWMGSPGLTWGDGPSVYRLSPSTGVVVAGTLDSAAVDIQGGPLTFLRSHKGRTWRTDPGQPPREVEGDAPALPELVAGRVTPPTEALVAGSPGSRLDQLLYGPGGACWDLEAGALRWRHEALDEALLQALPGGVAAHAQSGLTFLSAEGVELEALDGELPPEADDPEASIGGLWCPRSAVMGGRRWGWTDTGMLLSEPA